MEDEIKVGEYVRTVKEGIKRIDTIFENRPVNRYGYEVGSDWAGKEYSIIKTTDIVKHSKNIIDLIEVGDYVNGSKVVGKNGNLGELVLREDTGFLYINKGNNISKIKSIVTKEMFASMEYKVKE